MVLTETRYSICGCLVSGNTIQLHVIGGNFFKSPLNCISNEQAKIPVISGDNRSLLFM